jgi:hypothetical protein
MNPIIDILRAYLNNGEQPISFVSAYVNSTTEHAVEVYLPDSRREVHELTPQDHAEFIRWFTEAHNWWESMVHRAKQLRAR